MEDFRTGYVALFGKPNAGKSTLLNELLGVKLAAVSGLPQTTRDKFLGIHSDDDCQIIFVDLPGMVAGDDHLNEVLRQRVMDAVADVDAVLYLIDSYDQRPWNEDIAAAFALINKPIIAVLTKLDGKNVVIDPKPWLTDRLPKKAREAFSTVLGISSHENRGIDILLSELRQRIPIGNPVYDPDDLTDRDMRYLSQELIREKAYSYLHEELPYAIAVQIEEFNEREAGKWYVAATLFVEKESQKGMVIGKQGAMLKKISKAAREDIEDLTGMPVYLDLWVKVRHKWRRNERDLREFGYTPEKKKKTKKKGKRS